MVKCPFKFLDSFTEKDVNYFFGREKESNDLYDFVEKNRVVLVYGPLGTGKTSLVRCGLEKKFGSINWCPVTIRRGENINSSMLATLKERMPAGRKSVHAVDTDSRQDAINMLEVLSAYYIAPVFLIFDQFEEFLLFADADEKKLFAAILDLLRTTDTIDSCNIILVMREEFFGLLDKFEKEYMPGLSDRRLRVDPMQPAEIKQMILDTFNYPEFNITLQEDRGENVQRMFDALMDKKGEVTLPNLQIYLDGLWREDFARTYPNGYDQPGYPPLEITAEEITLFGNIQDVLERFVSARGKKIDEDIRQSYPATPQNFVFQLLNQFVSAFGTKVPVSFVGKGGEYFCKDIEETFLNKVEPGAVQKGIKALVENKILRIESNTIELVHDSLARLIDNQRDSKERKWIRIRVSIQSYMKEKGESISLEEVKAWDREIPNCGLSKEEMDYFRKAKAQRLKEERARLFKEEMAENEKKLKEAVKAREDELGLLREKEKAIMATRKKRRMTIYLIVSLLLCGLLIKCNADLISSNTKLGVYDFINRQSNNIPRKADVFLLARDIYGHVKNNADSTPGAVRNFMMRLSNDPEFLKELAVFSVPVDADVRYKLRENIDISADGRFLMVKINPDSLQTTENRFFLFDLYNSGSQVKFDSLNYAYFLGNSDTLLLAPINTVRLGLTNSNRLILFDCLAGKPIDTFSLQHADGQKSNFLYTPDFLEQHRYSAFDSYDVRPTKNGGLMVPYLRLSAKQERNQVALLDRDLEPIGSPYQSDFSTSISKDHQYVMIGQRGRKGNTITVLNDRGRRFPFQPANFDYADFTPDNGILYSSHDTLYVTSSLDVSPELNNLSSLKLANDAVSYVYADWQKKQSVSQLNKLIQVNVYDHSNTIPDTVLGVNFQNETMLTVGYDTGNCAVDSTIKLRSLNQNGEVKSSTAVHGCIRNLIYNPASGRLAVCTFDRSNNQRLYLYLYDASLAPTASFIVAASDVFFFSGNGQRLLLLRGKELLVFDLTRPLLKAADFNDLLTWNSHYNNADSIVALRTAYKEQLK